MKKQHVGTFQIIISIILFQLGSSTFLNLGREAGKDAWITILISAGLGILLLYMYISIYSFKKNAGIVDIFIAGFGRFIGTVIGILYAIYFIYLAARVTADFGFFIDNHLSNINIIVVKISILFLVAYITFLGIETLMRSSEIFFFLTFLFLGVIFLLFIFQETIEYKNLLPVFAEDRSNMIKSIFPSLLTIPFGEVVAFIPLFHFLKDFKSFAKKGWLAVIVSGLVLSASAFFTIAILTKELSMQMTFPFVSAIQHITFLKFITHFEVLAVVIFMMGGLVKICIYFYAGIHTLSKVMKVSNQNIFIIPLLILIYILTQLYMENYIEHITIGVRIVPVYVHHFQIFLPLLLLLMLFLKNKFSET